jgi:hypothetical protein
MCQRAAQLILRSAISRAAQPLLEVTRGVELLHLILSTLFGKPPPPVPGLFSDSSGTFMSTLIFLLGVIWWTYIYDCLGENYGFA